MRVYERIRQHIDSSGMRLNFVAQKTDIELKKFYRIVNGKTDMTIDEYENICIKGLSLDPAFFFKKIS